MKTQTSQMHHQECSWLHCPQGNLSSSHRPTPWGGVGGVVRTLKLLCIPKTAILLSLTLLVNHPDM